MTSKHRPDSDPEEKHTPEPAAKRPGRRPGGGSRFLLFLLLMAGLLVWPWLFAERQPQIAYTRFKQELKAGNIRQLVAEGESLRGEFVKPVTLEPDKSLGRTGEAREAVDFQTKVPPFGDRELTAQIVAQDLTFISRGSGGSMLQIILLNAIPVLLLIGFFVYMSKRAAQQSGGLLSIGRSRARKFDKEMTTVTFNDVAGLEEAKQSLKEIIGFLKEPERFVKLGCRVPKGMLLMGPPGTGKTLLAKATAGEADVPFYSITGSDFVEMFVGVGASRVRDLFATVKKNTPCIVFLDELDSVGRQRGAGLGGGHDEREQTLNQLLSEIDGFETTDNVVILAATNRPDVLDPALLRPGRFDRRVSVDLPTRKDRIAILKVHARKVPLADDVDLEQVAESMPGRSGADLSNVVNEAALLAARRGQDTVQQRDFREARDQILMGRTRGGIVLRGAEKETVAVHESGHALAAHLVPEADPVEKISIIPRGRSLGATQQLPEERYNLKEGYLRGRLMVLLGGRAAEEVMLGAISTGAADDLSQATRLARRMVTQWGMSEKLKNTAFEEGDEQVFLGEQITHTRHYSEHTAQVIDEEVKRIIDTLYDDVTGIFRRQQERLQTIGTALSEHETLEGDTLTEMLGPADKEQDAQS